MENLLKLDISIEKCDHKTLFSALHSIFYPKFVTLLNVNFPEPKVTVINTFLLIYFVLLSSTTLKKNDIQFFSLSIQEL